MKTDYKYIIVESFNPSDTSGRHGPTHVRPIPGQGVFKTNMFVECSKNLVTDYPIGTRFRIKVKITNREGGTPFIYSHYSWHYDVTSDICFTIEIKPFADEKSWTSFDFELTKKLGQ